MKNKSLVITGASRGIGREAAALFWRSGYRIINLSRSLCDLACAVNIALDLSDRYWR